MSSNSRFTLPYATTVDGTGVPRVGAKLNFYTTGTSTRANTYSDSALTTANANPVSADGNGQFPAIFLDPGITYKAVLTTIDGTSIWTADPVSATDLANLGGFSFIGVISAFQAATISSTVNVVQTTGYYTAGDGGAATYIRTSVTGAGAGKVQSADGQWWKLVVPQPGTPWVDPRMLGAKGDGVADDSTAITNAASLGPVIFSSGTYAVASSISIGVPVFMTNGAKLQPANSKTITFNASFTAPAAQVFTNATAGQGTIAFGSAVTPIGYPEWWGCVANAVGSKVVNTAAILACYTACPVTQFQQADYYTTGTLKLNVAHRSLFGYSRHWGAIGDSTRIITDSATLDTIQVGPDTNPGAINSFLQEVHLRWLNVTRSTAVTGNATYNTNPAGIRFQYTLYGSFKDGWTTENSLGVIFFGTSNIHCENVYAFRSTSGTNVAQDPFFGFFYDGSASIGAAGGNASTYLSNCNVSVGSSPTLTISAGVYGFQGYTDFFVDKLETASTQYGAYLSGASAPSGGTQDFRMQSCVFDSCKIAGVYITGGGVNSVINLVDIYVADAVSASWNAAIVITGQGGMTSITSGQFLMGINNPDTGLSIVNSSGVTVTDLLIRECYKPLTISGSSNCSIRFRTYNPTVGATTAAVIVTGTNSKLYIAPSVSGGAGSYPIGISLASTTTTASEFNCTGIDSVAINGGAANKLVYNGVQTTAVNTAFGTNNLSSGVMA